MQRYYFFLPIEVLHLTQNAGIVCDANYDIWSDAQAFEDQLKSLIVQLQEIPRLFVNLVSIFNISQVFDKSKDVLYCRTVHDILGMVEVHTSFHLRLTHSLVKSFNITVRMCIPMVKWRQIRMSLFSISLFTLA